MSLSTPRLLLRHWRDTDRDAFAAMSKDAEVMELLGGVMARAESDAFAARNAARFAEHGYGFWAIELPGSAGFIGFAGLAPAPDKAPFAPAIEIGWRLARTFWGQGYATEAASAVLEDGFRRLDLAEILATTTPMNQRSWAVMERLGMSRVANGDFDHPNVREGHRLRRHMLYRLSRETWQEACNG